jgi:hypothetical protein
MEFILILVGAIIDRILTFGWGTIKRWAEYSLLRNLRIEKDNTSVSYEGITYWCIRLLVSKGNILAPLFCRGQSNLKLTASVTFQSFETEPSIAGQNRALFEGDVYEINKGWGRRRIAFSIKRNEGIKLAVVRRLSSRQGQDSQLVTTDDIGKRSLYLYPIGNWANNYPLIDTYDVILNLEIDGENKPVALKENRIKEYIKEGKI